MQRMPRRGTFGYVLLIILLTYTALYVPTPFVVYEPGSAEDVGPIVQIGQAGTDLDPPESGEDGIFMLTTVRLSYANVWKYVQAALSSDAEIYRKSELFPPGQSLEDYSRQQSFVMQTSQSSAIMAAYNEIGIAYEVRPAAVYVADVLENMPAEGILQPGDRIGRINGREVRAIDDLLAVVRAHQVGEKALVEYERNKALAEAEIALEDMAKVNPEAEPGTPGIGIRLAEYREIVPEDPSRAVRLTVENIGGPSAGLMFALEIYRQLTGEPLAHGYRVAGTGEIYPDGKVGPIGGVQHKVVAAHRARAELFLVPVENYKEAVEKAEQMGTPMVIKAVHSLAEALDHLRALPAKEGQAA